MNNANRPVTPDGKNLEIERKFLIEYRYRIGIADIEINVRLDVFTASACCFHFAIAQIVGLLMITVEV